MSNTCFNDEIRFNIPDDLLKSDNILGILNKFFEMEFLFWRL